MGTFACTGPTPSSPPIDETPLVMEIESSSGHRVISHTRSVSLPWNVNCTPDNEADAPMACRSMPQENNKRMTPSLSRRRPTHHEIGMESSPESSSPESSSPESAESDSQAASSHRRKHIHDLLGVFGFGRLHAALRRFRERHPILGDIVYFYFGSWWNIFVFIPFIAIVVNMINPLNDALIFVFALMFLARMASMLSYLTEQLEFYVSPLTAGLANASVGNLPELFVAVKAVFKRKYDLVSLSLLGSTWSNYFVVFATSLIAGGFKNGIQKIPRQALQAVCMPAVLFTVTLALFRVVYDGQVASGQSWEETSKNMLLFGRLFSIAQAIVYVISVIRSAMSGTKTQGQEGGESALLPQTQEVFEEGVAQVQSPPEEPEMNPTAIGICLILSSALIYMGAEPLVDSLDGFCAKLHVPRMVTMVVILPITGNAAEHWSSITAAMRNQLDLAISCSIGSLNQIGYLVIPLVVVVAWMHSIPYLPVFEWWQIIATASMFALVCFQKIASMENGLYLILVYILVTLICFIFPMHDLPSFQ